MSNVNNKQKLKSVSAGHKVITLKSNLKEYIEYVLEESAENSRS